MVPEHRKTERRVRVEFHHIKSGVGLRLTQQGENLKRAGLWNHVPRNQRVAFVANQVVPQHQQANGGVVVLVEGVEHALSLSSVLPGWPIVTAEYVNDAGLTTHQKDLLRAGRNPFRDYSKPVIATSSALEKLDLSAVAAIIRADGGIGLPQIARQQLIAEPTRAALELHEFDDRHHPELGHDSRIRRRQYVERGWFAPGVDLVSARAERFLDSRPTLGRIDK